MKGIRRKKRMLVADSVKRVRFSDRGAIQAVEDLSIRPTTVAVSKHAKIALKRSSASKESSRTKRRQRRRTQSSPSLAPQASHVTRVINKNNGLSYRTQFCGALHHEQRYV